MVRPATERILLIGDGSRQIHGALAQVLPGSQITAVGTWFDAISELAGGSYTAILANAEPIERRPEAAVRTLRQLAGSSRLLLFAHPTLEPISRKMLEFGCDDYIITPAAPAELQEMFGTPPLRLTGSAAPATEDGEDQEAAAELPASAPSRAALLLGVPLAEILLEALVQHPQQAVAEAVKRINPRLAPAMHLAYVPAGAGGSGGTPEAATGATVLSHGVRSGNDELGTLHLTVPRDEEQNTPRHFLAQLAHLVGRLGALQERHNRLQKLAITDDLTGLYNGRYFRHFLSRIVEKARDMRFPVTLLLFDIDNFKQYNDLYGHGVGDQILRQTAVLIKRCCRDHDLVARISGDEFAVVFWEKEGPRQPREPGAVSTGRPPQTPLQIFDRFRKLLSTQDFDLLGKAGPGMLTISGGLAVYPYDAHDPESLIEEADRRLMFRAKRAGKDSLVLVGDAEKVKPPEQPGADPNVSRQI
jgi:GGDEF domain-containing protein